MRKSVFSLAVFSLVTAVAFLASAAGSAGSAPELTPGEPAILESCSDLPLDQGQAQVVNVPLGMPDPDPAQIAIPRCNCTRPGTPIPPGQLGIKCATPIGGPPKTCQAVVCLQNINTPWIDGVCG